MGWLGGGGKFVLRATRNIWTLTHCHARIDKLWSSTVPDQHHSATMVTDT
jgi:hypothetical protein